VQWKARLTVEARGSRVHNDRVVELIPESYIDCLDPRRIFERPAPLHVDLGCGDGSFLSLLAGQTPDHNFLGIERLAGRVRSAARKASQLPNVRVLRVETGYAVRYLLPPKSVHVFYLLFPDPWPKRKHHQRRIVTPEFLDAITIALTNDGRFCLATDQLDYFEVIERLVQLSGHLRVQPMNAEKTLPLTTFEKRFVAADAPIYRMELRKVSPVM
jgi:tRNA (guanine-N7-)-methyltransferase